MKRILATILSLVLSLQLVGCANSIKTQENNNSNMITSTNTPNETHIDQYCYLTEESVKNLISVQIPVVTTANAQAVNACIKEQVYNELQNWLSTGEYHLSESATPIANMRTKIDTSEYSTLYLHISGYVSFKNDEFISLVFTGDHNVKSAAHPNEVFFSVNIDIQTVQRVGVADIYAVDEALYTAFLQYMNSERISHDELLAQDVFNEDAFLNGITREPETGFYSYFTPDRVGISYPVAHALGDHIEAEIPCNDLEDRLIIKNKGLN